MITVTRPFPHREKMLSSSPKIRMESTPGNPRFSPKRPTDWMRRLLHAHRSKGGSQNEANVATHSHRIIDRVRSVLIPRKPVKVTPDTVGIVAVSQPHSQTHISGNPMIQDSGFTNLPIEFPSHGQGIPGDFAIGPPTSPTPAGNSNNGGMRRDIILQSPIAEFTPHAQNPIPHGSRKLQPISLTPSISSDESGIIGGYKVSPPPTVGFPLHEHEVASRKSTARSQSSMLTSSDESGVVSGHLPLMAEPTPLAHEIVSLDLAPGQPASPTPSWSSDETGVVGRGPILPLPEPFVSGGIVGYTLEQGAGSSLRTQSSSEWSGVFPLKHKLEGSTGTGGEYPTPPLMLPEVLSLDAKGDIPRGPDTGLSQQSRGIELVEEVISAGPGAASAPRRSLEVVDNDGDYSAILQNATPFPLPVLGETNGSHDTGMEVLISINPDNDDDIEGPQLPESTASLIEKLNGYKLETEFQPAYMVHRTQKWRDLSSTREWEMAVWKKMGKIGSGAYGSVWLQKQEGLGPSRSKQGGRELRAVKKIARASLPEAGASQELLALVKMRGYDHLFVEFLGWFEDKDYTFLAMEYIEYGDLGSYITQRRPNAEAKEITRQILEGLQVLHSKQIYHRDIKPQNILMASLDPIWVKITDFGASKRAKNTCVRTLVGTQGYLAPEVLGALPQTREFKTQGFVPHALDIWSLGSVVHELLTSQTPFMDPGHDSDSELDSMSGLAPELMESEAGIDMASLQQYCQGITEFPTGILQRSQLADPPGAISFVKSLLIANPKDRPTARRSLQDPWLRGYTSPYTQELKDELSLLGIEIDLGSKEQILLRQVSKGDIMRYLPGSVKVLPLLQEATGKGCNTIISRILESRNWDTRSTNSFKGGLFKVAAENRQHDTIKLLFQHSIHIEASVEGQTVLQWAVQAGETVTVDLLLKNAVDVNSNTSYQEALKLAIRSGDIDMVRVFLENNLDTSTPDENGETALRVVAESDHVEIVKLLLSSKTGVGLDDFKGGQDMLEWAVMAGKISTVDVLLQSRLQVRDSIGCRNALLYAIESRHIGVVEAFLNNKVDINTPFGNGKTPLEVAAHTGSIGIVKLLLEYKADVNTTVGDHNAYTALQTAAGSGHISISKLLLEAGADINAQPARGRTALQAASGSGHTEVVKLLLDDGADVNAGTALYGGRTALQAAAEGGHMGVVQILCDNGADINADPATYNGRTALQASAGNGHLEVLKFLLASDADVNAQPATENGRTALQAAAEGGHIEVLKLLLKGGADIDAPAGQDNGLTALQAAAQSNHIQCFSLLSSVGDIGVYDSDDMVMACAQDALVSAIKSGDLGMVVVFLRRKVNLNTPFSDGKTPLQVAAQSGSTDIVKLLLDHHGDINAVAGTDSGRTALQAAAESGNLNIVRLLLDSGADVNGQPATNNGRTAAQAAAEGGHFEIVSLLLGQADINAPASPVGGRTALQGAAESGHTDVLNLLLSNGADVNSEPAPEKGRTALQGAAGAGHLGIVTLLLNKKADVNAQPSVQNGRTALQAAAGGGHVSITKLLLENNANVNAPAASMNGRTALQAAAEGGHTDIVTLLLDSKANVHAEATTINGRTALQAAAEGGYIDIVMLLVGYGVDINEQAAMNNGRTSLQAAAGSGHIDIVQLLLKKADVNAAAGGHHGRTALQAAAEAGHMDIVTLLLDNKADVNAKAAGSHGRTALQAAAGSGHIDIVKLLLPSVDVNARVTGYHNRTALQAAAEGGHTDIVRLLLECKADVNAKPAVKYGRTALQAAAGSGHMDIVKLLLENKADVNAEAERWAGRTALQAAAEGGHLEVVKFLLENNGDLLARKSTSRGVTVLEAAKKSGNWGLIRFLDGVISSQ